ncbi:glycoside hydrolase family 79 protein [Daedaleopsis nitida]|nr:glycoside hydrolase family 79 protein [Daedaleopsis nitida]
MFAPLLTIASLLASLATAVTVYGPLGSTTITGPPPTGTSTVSTATTTSFVTVPGPPHYTELAAYNTIYMLPPAIPDPPPSNTLTIGVANSAQNMNGLSIPQKPTFFGFSIEMSVATQLIGKNSTRLNVPFLNLMALMVERAGAVHVRVGGNSQETAFMVDSFADGGILEKDKENASNPTGTPVLAFTPDLIYMLSNVSSLVNVKWYLGVPFNDTTNFRFQIAEVAEVVLGDNLLGFQAGNEPDLYGSHQHRKEGYSQFDYFGEFAQLTQAYQADANVANKKSLIAPSVQGADWGPRPEAVWDTGFVQAYDQYLSALSVEHYPSDNCAVIFPQPNNPPKDPIQEFPTYLKHSNGQGLVSNYLNSTMFAQQVGKPFLMFETNTASCGGFPGISDTFASALWALDYGLQMTHSNFSGALLHAGGQNVSYNPFTAPPTNESSFHQWTVGPIFYSAMVVAEALGKSNTSQVKDMLPDNNEFNPVYSVYENGVLARMVMINYLTDPSGAHDYTATVNVGGDQFGEANSVPAQVKVKYLLAPSVSEKDNITWGGQTLGGRFQVDGRLQGEENVQTVPCDQTANSCQIRVPAPGAALVYFSDDAQSAASAPGQDAQTFPTTVLTKTKNTVSVDPAVLATAQGMSGKDRQQQGGTSEGGTNGATAVAAPWMLVVTGAAMGLALCSRRLSALAW